MVRKGIFSVAFESFKEVNVLRHPFDNVNFQNGGHQWRVSIDWVSK